MRGNNVLGIIFPNVYDNVLSELTALRSMGSVPFGGRYRLIDFPLSSMVSCGISKVGIITKSNYQSLMDHVGSGRAWDLSRKTAEFILYLRSTPRARGFTAREWRLWQALWTFCATAMRNMFCSPTATQSAVSTLKKCLTLILKIQRISPLLIAAEHRRIFQNGWG